jgi:hypothetical protein
MLCFHGTTMESLVKILNGEEKSSSLSTWSLSGHDGLLYMIANCDDYYSVEECKIEAYVRGMLSAAIQGSSDVVSIELDIPENKLNRDFSSGDSDRNRTIKSININQYITNIYIDENYKVTFEERISILRHMSYNRFYEIKNISDDILEIVKEKRERYSNERFHEHNLTAPEPVEAYNG